jgi:hypothetical protein
MNSSNERNDMPTPEDANKLFYDLMVTITVSLHHQFHQILLMCALAIDS